MLSSPDPPSWLCHHRSPLPAFQEKEARLPITSSSAFQLISGQFLPVSSTHSTNLSEQWISLLRRDTMGGGVSLALSLVEGTVLAPMGRVEANQCPSPAPGKGKIPDCKARGENDLGLNSQALCVAIYGCTFCSKPDARGCKRERKQTGES